MRAWEDVFKDHPDPSVERVYEHWKRNRAFFDETEGLATGRDVEFALREKTDHAHERLDEAEDAWAAAGYPYRGRKYRRWGKRWMDFFKAMYAENREYAGTLLYRGLDPDDDAQIEDFLAVYRSDD